MPSRATDLTSRAKALLQDRPARRSVCKTVSVALSREQYEAMREAIGNWRVLKARLSRLEELSRTVIFETLPDTRRSKPPSRATLGLGKRPKSP